MKTIISNRLKSARVEKGFTQAEIAEALGMERGSYTQIETGRNMLTLENLVKLPKVLGKPVTYFLGIVTDNLPDDEAELLELYRALPPGELKDNVLITVRATVQQASRDQLANELRNLTPEQRLKAIETVKRLFREDD